jgi:hypothetical protein
MPTAHGIRSLIAQITLGLCPDQKRLERGRFVPLRRRSREEMLETTLKMALFVEGNTLGGAIRLFHPPACSEAFPPFIR